MSEELSREIIKQILSNFLVTPSSSIDDKSFQSLCDNSFLVKEKLSFLVENNETIHNKIWGCSLVFATEEIKILLGDCSQDSNKELCMIVSLSNSPSYGLYICLDNLEEKSLIACTTDNKTWLPCNIFLQATFLAGMEQIKDFFVTAKNIDNYNVQHQMLLSLIRFYNSLYDTEELYEG